MGVAWAARVVVATALAVWVTEAMAGAETAVARAAARAAEGTVAGSVEAAAARREVAMTAAVAAAGTREDAVEAGSGQAAAAARAGARAGVLWVAVRPRRRSGRGEGGRRPMTRPCSRAWGRRSCRR